MPNSQQPRGIDKLRQWWPILLVAAAVISSSSVEGYQLIDLRGRVEALETEQVQQIRLEEQTKGIKDDVSDLEEDLEEVNGKLDSQNRKMDAQAIKLDLIIQRLGN